MRHHPHLFETNARLFLNRNRRKYRKEMSLVQVPEHEWAALKRQGFDLVWLMGVWRRSPGARGEALRYPGLQLEYDRALPDWTQDDVAGSPYAVYDYRLDPALGQPDDLPEIKKRLNSAGLGLILDFVVNHVALDHPWVSSHPGRLVRGLAADAARHPDWFYSAEKGLFLAHGRERYFPAWTDTAQLNLFAAETREALAAELARITEVADGVRCDMAMLALNEVFQQIWGEIVRNEPPPAEFWNEIIPAVKARKPGFLFLAEAYWGLEGRLRELGFDFTYDKVLYDKLRYAESPAIRDYILSDTRQHRRSVHFIENHDEDRALAAFGRERSLAAAVAIMTTPGMRLLHEGQMEGRRVRVPIQLIRQQDEPTDTEVAMFYRTLLRVVNGDTFHEGDWALVEVGEAAATDESYRRVLAWRWLYDGNLKIVVVNYSPESARGWLKFPLGLTGEIILLDELNGVSYTRSGKELASRGLYIALGPYRTHVLAANLR
ncbi:MAG: alpha-amylase [Chloroflexi bacterium]|nr:alpha-amylase [Chloroflexota bacterium]